MYPDMSVAEYRKYARLRADALNHALRDIPREKIRLHVCWGSFHGPHSDDIPLKDIADIIFRVRASEYSIEASNPAHEHEWAVFENAKVPEDAALIPGVVGHCTDFIENPELVAQRLTRYANLVGRENVMAGTDCGMGPRVNDPKICWAKFEAMVEGARLATKQLWAKGGSATREPKPAGQESSEEEGREESAGAQGREEGESQEEGKEESAAVIDAARCCTSILRPSTADSVHALLAREPGGANREERLAGSARTR